MDLNTIAPAENSKKSPRRLGRGFTRGKTCGRGHKGYKSRSGSSVPASFEGGQMPLQRRLPKFGFSCKRASVHSEVRTSEINAVLEKNNEEKPTVDLDFLKMHKIISTTTKTVKVFLSGSIAKPCRLAVRATKGAREAVIAVGGEYAECK